MLRSLSGCSALTFATGFALLSAPAGAVTFDDGQEHLIDAANSYPFEGITVSDGPGGAATALGVFDGGVVGTSAGFGIRLLGRSEAAISGGQIAGRILLQDDSSLKIYGGDIDSSVDAVDAAELKIYGGTMAAVTSAGEAAVGFTGATTDELILNERSAMTISGGVIVGRIVSQYGQASLRFSGGLLEGHMSIAGESTEATISGGDILGDVTVSQTSSLLVRGGNLAGRLLSLETAAITLIGSEFDHPFGQIGALAGTLTGSLADGLPISVEFEKASTATITLKPAHAPIYSADIVVLEQGSVTFSITKPALIKIDPVTGEQFIISTGGLLSNAIGENPLDFDLDVINRRFVVVDRKNSIIGISFDGSQTLLATADSNDRIMAIAVESPSTYIVATERRGPSSSIGTLRRLDLDTGVFSLVSSAGLLDGSTVRDLEIDQDEALVVSMSGNFSPSQIIKVDAITGSQELLTQIDNGQFRGFTIVENLAFIVIANIDHLLVSNDQIATLDLLNGSVTPLTSGFQAALDVDIDDRGGLLILDQCLAQPCGPTSPTSDGAVYRFDGESPPPLITSGVYMDAPSSLLVVPPLQPIVTGHRVIDCTAQQEIATLIEGEIFSVDVNDLAQPACLGVGVLMEANTPSGDGSMGYNYTPAPGENVTSPNEGENFQPFAMVDEYGWLIEGEVAQCHCDNPERGTLAFPGTHVIESQPCTADVVSWTAGDKSSQCEAAGGLAGAMFTTQLDVVPEPSVGLMLLFGAMGLTGLARQKGGV